MSYSLFFAFFVSFSFFRFALVVPPEPNDPQRDWDSNLRRGWDSNDINEDTSVTDGLMRKMEDEQRLDDDQAMTQFDVKIGVGMDIAIHGENGNNECRTFLNFVALFHRIVFVLFPP